MFYKQQGGGPWGGGPWGSGGGGGGNNPWGGRDRGTGGSSGPPDLEELLRRSQDRVRQLLPGGFGSGRSLWALAGLILLHLYRRGLLDDPTSLLGAVLIGLGAMMAYFSRMSRAKKMVLFLSSVPIAIT